MIYKWFFFPCVWYVSPVYCFLPVSKMPFLRCIPLSCWNWVFFLLLIILEEYLKLEKLEILEKIASNLGSYSLSTFSLPAPLPICYVTLLDTDYPSELYLYVHTHTYILMLTGYIPFLIGKSTVVWSGWGSFKTLCAGVYLSLKGDVISIFKTLWTCNGKNV